MSAWYPLVTKRYAFSTRFGVSRSPSRAGSSPSCASSCLIKSCIVLFYIPVVFGQGAAAVAPATVQAAPAANADALYAERADVASARRAAAIWQQQPATDAHDFAAAWKL